MQNERVLPFGFCEKLQYSEEKALQALDDSDAALLSAIHLSSDSLSFLSCERTSSLLDRGFLIKEDGRLRVSAAGMKGVSTFPLLGKKARRRLYPEAFIPFVLSVVASRNLQSGRWQRNLSSDFFTSLFPSIEKGKAITAAERTIEAMIRLGIAIDDGECISISRPAAQSFMALSEEERIAMIIGGEGAERKKIALAIALSQRLSGIEKENADEYLDRIGRIAGYRPSLEDLETFSLIDEDNGILTGRKRGFSMPLDAAVSSDFSITYSGASPEDIYLYATPVRADSTTEWKLTKASMKTAFSLGITPDEAAGKLEELSSFPLPESLRPRISLWHRSFLSVRAQRALILQADERNARIIDALPTLRMHIIGKIGETIFLMDDSTEGLWRRALENAGFDMLGPTEGPAFEKAQERRIQIAPSDFRGITLPEEREIPFSAQRRNELLAASDSPLRTALINSGFITDSEEETPSVDMVNGLYYQEKMRLIAAAEHDGQKIYLESLDGSAIIGHPRHLEESFISLSGIRIDAAKAWKAAILPPSVKDSALRPSDSDSQ